MCFNSGVSVSIVYLYLSKLGLDRFTTIARRLARTRAFLDGVSTADGARPERIQHKRPNSASLTDSFPP